ncbi:MAG: hypothetical protein E6G28_10405 [Actinobacteria bacterium]|nr:MAG: hypothetical protein E6G28_10405 [Actinomycetota bacterium]
MRLELIELTLDVRPGTRSIEGQTNDRHRTSAGEIEHPRWLKPKGHRQVERRRPAAHDPELRSVASDKRAFAAATGLRPEEWAPLEWRDVDRRAGIVSVRRTVSDGDVVELGKTSKSRRQVPLSRRALAALEALPRRLDVPQLWPGPAKGLLRLDNFRRREWSVAIGASGVERPARIYDLRSPLASNALAAGVTVFELARVMGTSVAMIERHYGTLLDGAQAGIVSRLDALDAELVAASSPGSSLPH